MLYAVQHTGTAEIPGTKSGAFDATEVLHVAL